MNNQPHHCSKCGQIVGPKPEYKHKTFAASLCIGQFLPAVWATCWLIWPCMGGWSIIPAIITLALVTLVSFLVLVEGVRELRRKPIIKRK